MQATTVLTGGVVLSMDQAQPVATALALSGTQVMALGNDDQILSLAGPGTVRVDLAGRCVMPGLIEAHTHALWGACRDLFEVYVGYTARLDDIAAAIGARVAALPAGSWVRGGPWRLDMRAALGMSPRDWLDSIAPLHPVALSDTTQHALWCNSAALTLAGIDADITGGVIGRLPDGRPDGFLAEAACAPVRRLLHWRADELDMACDAAMARLAGYGYTGFKEPMAGEDELATYARAHDDGRLTLRAAAHLTAYSPLTDKPVSLDEIARMRVRYARPGLKLSFAKLFIDGVAPALTASFLAPYLPRPGYDPLDHDPDATLLLPPETLNGLVASLDAAGLVVKMHAVGDNAVRKGLDAIAAARAANGPTGLRHEIAHTTFVDDADLPRFAALGAVAEVSPKLWMPNPGTRAQAAVLGEDRLSQVHRIRSLLEAGAEVIVGTDWPASAADANPWTGLAGMLTRRDVTGTYPGSVASDQAITLEQALPLLTVNGARAMQMEDMCGRLSPGMAADLVILPEDIRRLSPEDIAAIQVVCTVVGGQIVHGEWP